MKVIVDRKEGPYFIGRTEFSSPDVDPEVLIPVSDNPHVRTGRFYQVKITGSEDYDLYGKIIAHEY
jgi:ribosomal protein S12 methylthiotransferase